LRGSPLLGQKGSCLAIVASNRKDIFLKVNQIWKAKIKSITGTTWAKKAGSLI
jgi:hypothetical protein